MQHPLASTRAAHVRAGAGLPRPGAPGRVLLAAQRRWAIYDDGLRSGVSNWMAYMAFVKHPLVEPVLRPFDLGSSEDEARHWLLLDREARTLSALPVEETAALLIQQWSTRPATLPLQWETLDPVPELLATLTGKRGWSLVWKDGAPVAQRRHKQAAQVEALCCWLNQQQGGGGTA